MALIADLRFALRQLRKRPAFTCSVVLTLALGTGATVAIFSLVHAVLLAPLPFPHSERLVNLTALSQQTNSGPAVIPTDISFKNLFDWRDQSRSFSSIGCYGFEKVLFTHRDGTPEQVEAGIVTGDSLRTLGVAPVLGRDFTRADEAKGNHSAILSYATWQKEYGGAADVIGKSLRANGESWTIVGVMPAQFAFPLDTPDTPFWLTYGHQDIGPNSEIEQRGWQDLDNVVGRLKPGVSREQAQAEMTAIQRGIAHAHPEEAKRMTGVRVQPALEAWVGDQARPLRLLFAAVCCLLLIACTNVAGMLLTRASERSGEIAVRTALGASRWRVMRQLLLEFSLLAIAGSGLGAALAAGALAVSRNSLPHLARIDQASVSGAVLLFAFGLAALTTLLFGLVPAWRAAEADPATLLQGGLRRNTTGRAQNRLHAALVVGETALSLLLLVGAGLLIRSFDRLLQSDLGFRADHLMTFRAFLPPQSKPPQVVQFENELAERLRALPDVQDVASSYGLPFSGANMTISFALDAHPPARGEEPSARLSLARADYAHGMQIPLLEGRWFTPDEDRVDSKAAVVAINQAFAQKYFPGEDPVGKTMTAGFGNQDDQPKLHRRIIGVLANTRRLSQSEAIEPEYFLPWGQMPIPALTVAVRTKGDPRQVLTPARQIVNSLAPGTPLYRVRTMDEAIERTSRSQRFQAALMTGFSVVALLLTAVGTYGLLSYVVAQRTTEFGVRLALGAQREDVIRLVMRRGLELTIAGLAIGTVVSVLAATWMTARLSSLLYQTKPTDPLVYGGTAGLLLLVAVVASWLPAYRASRLQPVEILRRP